MMPATQEFRNGASWAAIEMVERVLKADRVGIPLTILNINAIADALAKEMGGYVL